MKTLSNLYEAIRRVDVFAVIEKLLTLAALVLVAATLGNRLGPVLGIPGELGMIVAWSIAIVYDALWIGSLRMSELAIRQRSAIGMAVTLGMSAAAIGVSTATLLILGHAQVFAGVPVAAALFMGLRLFAGNVLADPTTAAQIAKRSAEDRNARALAAAHARHLGSEAHTEVLAETAEHRAELRRQIARAEVLTEAQAEIDEARAKAEKTLAAADRKHGEKAAAFMKRELVTIGSRPRVAPAGHTPAELQGHTRVTQVTPEIATVTPQPVTPDETDSDDWLEPDPEEVAPTAEELALLDQIALAASVDQPRPGGTLSAEQLAVVLRWLRYMMEPPRSYREAKKAFRKYGFRAKEQRVRLAWREIDALEAEVTPTA